MTLRKGDEWQGRNDFFTLRPLFSHDEIDGAYFRNKAVLTHSPRGLRNRLSHVLHPTYQGMNAEKEYALHASHRSKLDIEHFSSICPTFGSSKTYFASNTLLPGSEVFLPRSFFLTRCQFADWGHKKGQNR